MIHGVLGSLLVLCAFAQNAHAKDPSELQTFLRQSTAWHSAKLEKDIPLNVYFVDKRSTSPQQAPVIVYVKGLAAERLGQESDPVSYTHLTLPTICSV